MNNLNAENEELRKMMAQQDEMQLKSINNETDS